MGAKYQMADLTARFENFPKVNPQKPSRQIWAVGGGKGGVGKSLFTANISIFLALLGNRVIAVDLDLGGANLHTCLGVPIPQQTLSDYVNRKVKSLKELVVPTSIKNLSIISGAQDSTEIANLKRIQKNHFMRKIQGLDADYIIFDLGAGTTFNTLDFFIMAHKGILLALPEPTSIENTYRFVKSVYHRNLTLMEDLLSIGPLINHVTNSKLNQNITSHELVKKVHEYNPEVAIKLQEGIARLQPKLVINQVRTQSDIDVGFSMKSICKKYFGINVNYVGHLDYDSLVWKSIKSREPLLVKFPQCKLINDFDRITARLIQEDTE